MIRPLQLYSDVNNGQKRGNGQGQQGAHEHSGLKLDDKPETAREETPNCKSRRDESQQANIGKPKMSEHKRKCKAVIGSVVVEASFAKGDLVI
jgi:hypothetical protein